MNINRPKPFKKVPAYVLFVGGTVLIAALVYGGFRMLGRRDSSSQIGQTQDGQPVNLDPATEQEMEQVEEHKAELAKNQEQATSGSQSKQISVVVTGASSSGISAYVSGVFEEGGVCSATASNGDQTVTQTSVGFQNVSYTQCAPIEWTKPLSKGIWTIDVSYKSATSEGKQTQTLEVQ